MRRSRTKMPDTGIKLTRLLALCTLMPGNRFFWKFFLNATFHSCHGMLWLIGDTTCGGRYFNRICIPSLSYIQARNYPFVRRRKRPHRGSGCSPIAALCISKKGKEILWLTSTRIRQSACICIKCIKYKASETVLVDDGRYLCGSDIRKKSIILQYKCQALATVSKTAWYSGGY